MHTHTHTHEWIHLHTLSTDGCSRKAKGKLEQYPNQTVTPRLPHVICPPSVSTANHSVLSTQPNTLFIQRKLNTDINKSISCPPPQKKQHTGMFAHMMLTCLQIKSN